MRSRWGDRRCAKRKRGGEADGSSAGEWYELVALERGSDCYGVKGCDVAAAAVDVARFGTLVRELSVRFRALQQLQDKKCVIGFALATNKIPTQNQFPNPGRIPSASPLLSASGQNHKAQQVRPTDLRALNHRQTEMRRQSFRGSWGRRRQIGRGETSNERRRRL
jgi:hypothetical protein